MALRKRGTSPHSKYRHARQRIAELEAQRAKLERSRARTPGKKGSKTRTLNKLARQLSAARGLLTKARNAIAKASSVRAVTRREATAKRSVAAKKGWATRRSRVKAAPIAEPPKPAATSHACFMPFLTEGGVVFVNPLGGDRSEVGRYWHAVRRFLETGQIALLGRFEGRSIFDSHSQESLAFITDPYVILEHEAELDLGPGFYKRREEVTRFAA